jgi:hypothetical protein
VNPGDEMRASRQMARCAEARKVLNRASHLAAAASLMGLAAVWVIVMRADIEGAWFLIVCAFVLNYASKRASRRARELL